MASRLCGLQLVHEAGGQYLEAPVSGSKAPAEQGTLIFLTGGDEELFHSSAPLMDVMGKAKFYLGEASPLSQSRSYSMTLHVILA